MTHPKRPALRVGTGPRRTSKEAPCLARFESFSTAALDVVWDCSQKGAKACNEGAALFKSGQEVEPFKRGQFHPRWLLALANNRSRTLSYLGTRGETRFEKMLRPPFRVARNGESGGCLTAGHLQ